MSQPTDPVRLFDGGLVDGAPPSPEMLELLGILRGASADGGRLPAIRAGAVSRGSWGRWLLVVALALGVAASAANTTSSATTTAFARLGPPSPASQWRLARSLSDGPMELGAGVAAPHPPAAPELDRESPSPGAAAHAASAAGGAGGAGGARRAGGDGAVLVAPPGGARAAPRATHADAASPRPVRRARSARPPAALDVPASTRSLARAALGLDALAGSTSRVAVDESPGSSGLDAPLAAVAPAVVALGVAPPVAALDDAAPSELYASALADYARGCCDCAVTPLQHVIEGSTGDAPLAVRRAELLLGVCLARMGWTQSALSVLDAIVEAGAEHPYFSEALTQLARLASELPDPSVLVESFAHDDEARLVGEEPGTVDAAAYLQGRARYDASELSTAARLFARVSAASPFHRAARFYEGLAEVRLRHAGRAEAAFRAVIDASPEGDRHRDLATLALARLYYATAESRHAAGDDERESELVAQALEAWSRVPLTSEHFLDAFFEESWALYLAGEDSRALGHVFGLLSPFFETTEHPEAWVVRGTIHYEHCLYDEADADVRQFHARYDEVLASLAELSSMDDDEALALYRTRAAALTGPTRALVGTSILDRDAERRSDHLRAIEAESARLVGSPFARNTLGERLAQELGVSAALARSRLAEGVRERLLSAREALVERANEIDRIALETTTARRDLVTGEAVLSEESIREREIIAEVGVEVWPFDGEYWADEVTSYREVIRDRCGR